MKKVWAKVSGRQKNDSGVSAQKTCTEPRSGNNERGIGPFFRELSASLVAIAVAAGMEVIGHDNDRRGGGNAFRDAAAAASGVANCFLQHISPPSP